MLSWTYNPVTDAHWANTDNGSGIQLAIEERDGLFVLRAYRQLGYGDLVFEHEDFPSLEAAQAIAAGFNVR